MPLCMADRSKATVGMPAELPAALAIADLAAPGGPMSTIPSAFESCIQESIVPVISVFTPERSVPVPANAFSISSTKTITRGASLPPSTARRKCLIVSHPPMSAKVSPPRQMLSPGVCSMACRLRSQSRSTSTPFFESAKASTCSAGNAASPMSASTQADTVSSDGTESSASSHSRRTNSASSSADGKGSSIIITSPCSSAGSTAPGVLSNTRLCPPDLNGSRTFQIACTTSG